MGFKIWIVPTLTVLFAVGTFGDKVLAANETGAIQPVPLGSNQSVPVVHPQVQDESRSISRIFKRPSKPNKKYRTEGGALLNVDIPFPNPSFTFHRVLDFWPYNKIYTTNLFTTVDFGFWIVKHLKKFAWYLHDFLYLGLKIAFQVFDILEMRKSFIALSHSPGWSENENDDDDWR